MNSKFSVIIPARLNSSRLPNKALADIAGKPMVVRTAEQAKKSRAERIIVATDHDDIQHTCIAYGIDVIKTSSHHTSGTTRLAEATQLLGLPPEHIIVNVQGDEPMMPPELINHLAILLANSTASMATAACHIQNWHEFTDPNAVKVVCTKNNEALYFSRAPIPYPRDHAISMQLPDHETFLRHIGIYAYRANFLQTYHALSESPLEKIESLEQLRVLWHGYSIAVAKLEHAPPAGVDTPEDLVRVRTALLHTL